MKNINVKKNIIVFLTLTILITGCGLDGKKALNYNQKLVGKEDALVPDMKKTEAAVADFYTAKKFDSIAIAGKRMEQIIDNKIAEIQNEPAPDVKDAAEFKKAFINYFSYFKSVYTEYKNFGSAASDTDRSVVFARIQTLVAQKPQVLTDIKTIQAKFAKDNRFRVENQPK
jgi:hypothetical protein